MDVYDRNPCLTLFIPTESRSKLSDMHQHHEATPPSLTPVADNPLLTSLLLTGMCPKDDDPVTVNQDERTISLRVGTDFADSINGTLTVTFNG